MNNSMRTQPLFVAAATAVILTCLLAIGIMTGIIPSPLARDRAVTEERADASKNDRAGAQANDRAGAQANDRAGAQALRDDRPGAPKRPAADNRSTAKAPADRKTEAVGSTRSAAPSSTVAGSAPAVCYNCGTVTSVRAVKQQGEAGIVGPLAGGAIGGAIGSQIGGGSGKTIATIAGAAGGAAIGTEVERRSKSTTHYVVGVRLNDGTTRNFNYQSAPGVNEGDKIKVVDDRLIRDS